MLFSTRSATEDFDTWYNVELDIINGIPAREFHFRGYSDKKVCCPWMEWFSTSNSVKLPLILLDLQFKDYHCAL